MSVGGLKLLVGTDLEWQEQNSAISLYLPIALRASYGLNWISKY